MWLDELADSFRKAVGPAEFLPLLLAVTPDGSNEGSDPYSSAVVSSTSHQSQGALKTEDLVPFLNDLVLGFPDGTFEAVITPTLSLFFQEWFKISPTPTIIGSEWRKYLGAVAILVQVKPIAALVRSSESITNGAVSIITSVGSPWCGCRQNRVAIPPWPPYSSERLPPRICTLRSIEYR